MERRGNLLEERKVVLSFSLSDHVLEAFGVHNKEPLQQQIHSLWWCVPRRCFHNGVCQDGHIWVLH